MQLEPYIHELSTSSKNDLLLKIAGLVFPKGTVRQPALFSTFYEDIRALMTQFHPNEHLPFDREALTKSLGEYLVEWWGESLERPPTGRDLDRLFDDLPESGIREALKRLAERKDEDR